MTRETPGMASLFGKLCVSLRGLGRFRMYHDTLKNGFFMAKNGDFCKNLKYLYHRLLTFVWDNIY